MNTAHPPFFSAVRSPTDTHTRRVTRHPTPRAPVPLPACMSAPVKGLDGLLLGDGGGGESFWRGVGVGGGEGGAAAAAVEESVEWQSLGQRAVAVESCLFVLQVLKAARRRTIGMCVCHVCMMRVLVVVMSVVRMGRANRLTSTST